MKKTFFSMILLIIGSTAFGQTKPIKKPIGTTHVPITKYGALAIDRDNGFYYGWAFDQKTLASAESTAMQECAKRGGNCSIVLSYSGAGCAAYRTIDGKVGTAFGWGLGKTKAEADAIATEECLKRSGGISPTSFVWACNSAQSAPLKEIYNASGEIAGPVTIGNQVWSGKNLSVAYFRNGDPIPQAKTQKDWEIACREKTPAWCNLEFDSKNDAKYGKLYNFYAVSDRRNIAPAGWHVPSKREFEILISALGGEKVAGVKMRSKRGWDVKDSYNFSYGNGDNSSGLNLLQGGSAGSDEYGGNPSFLYGKWICGWWTTTVFSQYLTYAFDFDKYSRPRLAESNKDTGYSVRLIKD